MSMAYKDRGRLVIRDVPLEETRLGADPIATYSEALEVLERAKKERPDVRWKIEGSGPYRVCR